MDYSITSLSAKPLSVLAPKGHISKIYILIINVWCILSNSVSATARSLMIGNTTAILRKGTKRKGLRTKKMVKSDERPPEKNYSERRETLVFSILE